MQAHTGPYRSERFLCRRASGKSLCMSARLCVCVPLCVRVMAGAADLCFIHVCKIGCMCCVWRMCHRWTGISFGPFVLSRALGTNIGSVHMAWEVGGGLWAPTLEVWVWCERWAWAGAGH